MDNTGGLRVIAGGIDDASIPPAGAVGQDWVEQHLRDIEPRPGEPDYQCRTCRDTGWLPGEDGVRRCPDCTERERREREERIPTACGLPRRYRGLTLDTYRRDYKTYRSEAAGLALRSAEEYVRSWRESGKPPDYGLYVRGVGRAATALACAVTGELLADGTIPPEAALSGRGALFVGATELLDGLRTSYSEGAEPEKVRRQVEAPMLLVVDGLRDERPERKALDRFVHVLRARDSEVLPTLVISRFSPLEIGDLLDEDVAKILSESCDLLDLTEDDAG